MRKFKECRNIVLTVQAEIHLFIFHAIDDYLSYSFMYIFNKIEVIIQIH